MLKAPMVQSIKAFIQFIQRQLEESLIGSAEQFENGNPEMREVCFKTLTSWNDYSSSTLYEIYIRKQNI